MGAANTPLLQGPLYPVVLQLLKSGPTNGRTRDGGRRSVSVTAAGAKQLVLHRHGRERFPGALSLILEVE